MDTKIKFGLIVFLFFAIANPLFASQLNINGLVLDFKENTPIQSANIIFLKSGVKTTSDSKGKFSVTKIDENDTLLISYIGYESQKKAVAFLNANDEVIIKMISNYVPCQTILVEAQKPDDSKATSAYSIISKSEISKRITVNDVPEMLSITPSALSYSESGSSIGYSYLSIRGFDQRKLSISINGVPQNDPEDHNVYWVDVPNIIESAELVQVQRGSGNGIIGYPAIGGTVNIITSNFSDKARNEISITTASHNAQKYDAVFSSGIFKDKYAIYAKLSTTKTDGARDLSAGKYSSYYLSSIRYDKNLTSQINLYGGIVEDGLAYTGIPKQFIKNKQLRNVNYSYWTLDKEKIADYSVLRREEEGEKFFQPHFELLNEYKVNENLKIYSTLFLVLGNGYFDYDGSWSVWSDDYFRLKLNGFENANPENALIRAYVENKQWGWNGRTSYKHQNGELFAGLEYRNHRSLHWGAIEFAENLPKGVTKNYHYYEYNGGVDVINAFVHEKYNINEKISLLAEIQSANSIYEISNEKYLDNEFSILHNFVNPKIGANFKINGKSNTFLSFARVSKEPRLKSYYDAAESSGGETPKFEMINGKYDFSKPLIKPETMNDLELGYIYSNSKLSLNLNCYYMLFENEIVKEGQLDRFGQPITGNVPSSIHSGVEFIAKYEMNNYFGLLFNCSYSKNIIQSGKKFFNYQDKVIEIDMEGNEISGSPELISNLMLNFKLNNFLSTVNLRYVGKFYSNNFGSKFTKICNDYQGLFDYNDNVVEPSFVIDLICAYDANKILGLERTKFYLQCNNILDNLYASYAIGNEFFPADRRNFAIGLTVGF